jgi:hypothetical protein
VNKTMMSQVIKIEISSHMMMRKERRKSSITKSKKREGLHQSIIRTS